MADKYEVRPSKFKPGWWGVFRVSDGKEIMYYRQKGIANREKNRREKGKAE